MSFSIVYIHGFNSSPLSRKAQLFRSWIESTHPDITLHIPALKPYPLDAVAQLDELAGLNKNRTGFVGSSLGGFYAVYMAERFNAPAVLINPSVKPFETLSRYLGENENFYTQERYNLTEQHVNDLRSLYVERPSHPGQLLLLTQTADETLDFREGTTHFYASPSIIEYGGDHAFQNAERHFTFILNFLRKNIF